MKRVIAFFGGMALTVTMAFGIDLGEFQPHMKQAADSCKALKESLDAGNGSQAAAQAESVQEHFLALEKMFKADGVSDAALQSKESADAAGKIAGMASGGDVAGAAGHFSELTKNCKTCHSAHRTKDADGNYGIK